jgi:hypothetical protein
MVAILEDDHRGEISICNAAIISDSRGIVARLRARLGELT